MSFLLLFNLRNLSTVSLLTDSKRKTRSILVEVVTLFQFKIRFVTDLNPLSLHNPSKISRIYQTQVRFFFFGVACVLYNAWVATNLNILSPQKHPRKTSPVTSSDKTDSPYSPPLPLFDFITLLLGHYTRVDFFTYRKKGPPWVKDDKRLTRFKKSPLSPLNFSFLTHNA